MRRATWLLVVVAIGAIAQADPATGTVVISCNEADASLLVDGILIPERTPAVLTLPAGSHMIEARKPPLVAQKKVVEVGDQQQVKLRFELLPANLPPPPPAGSGSSAPPPAGSGSSAPPPAGSGSSAPLQAGSGSGAPPPAGSGSSAPPPPPKITAPVAKPSRCTEGGHEVPCLAGPRCTSGGKPIPCPGAPPPPPPVPPLLPPAAVTVGSGSGSAGSAEPQQAPEAASIEIVTAAPHAVAFVDGAPVRDAPCLLWLEPGEHVVAVYAAGMVPAEAVVRIVADQRQRVELTPSNPRRRIDVPAH